MVVWTFYHGTVSIVHSSIILLWYVLWYFGYFTLVLVNWKCSIALPSYFTQFTIIAMIFYTWYHLTMVLPWYYHSIFYFYHGNTMVFWYTMVFCTTVWRTRTIFLEIPCKYNVIWVPVPSYISKAYHNISLWCTMYSTFCKCSMLSLSHCVYVCVRMSASERFPESQTIKQKSALNSWEEMAIIK